MTLLSTICNYHGPWTCKIYLLRLPDKNCICVQERRMCWGHKICRSNKEKIYAIVTRYSTRRRTQLRLFANCLKICQSTGQRSNYVLERRGGVTIAAERATEKTLSTSRQGNGTDSTVETRIWGLLKFRWILSEKRGAGSQLQRTRHCLLDRATELLRLWKETCFRPKNWFRSSGRRRFVLVYLVF